MKIFCKTYSVCYIPDSAISVGCVTIDVWSKWNWSTTKSELRTCSKQDKYYCTCCWSTFFFHRLLLNISLICKSHIIPYSHPICTQLYTKNEVGWDFAGFISPRPNVMYMWEKWQGTKVYMVFDVFLSNHAWHSRNQPNLFSLLNIYWFSDAVLISECSVSVGIQKGALSPRPSAGTLQQSREQWYSVPPALGPLYHDFATTQLASIAQHKKQSQDSLPSCSSPPLSGSGSVRQKGKLQHSSSTGS